MPIGIYKHKSPWNKGLKGWSEGTTAGFQKGHFDLVPSSSRKIAAKKISKALMGKKQKPHTDEWKIMMREKMTGRKMSEDFKKKCRSHTGSLSSGWKGGKSFEKYTLNWTDTLKKSIRERDKYICQLCGKIQIEELENIEKKLAVHHKNYDKKNCDPNNLITLCHKCHNKTNHNRNYWLNYFN